MSKESQDGGLHIDSDWKEEAAREKERLAEQEQHEQRERAAAGPAAETPAGATAGTVPATFVELVNMLALQAAIGLGGYQGPGGERIPPNPAAAKHHIDLIEVLQKKTEGNLTDDESRVLDAVLYELRMQYVQTVTVPPPPSGKEKEQK